MQKTALEINTNFSYLLILILSVHQAFSVQFLVKSRKKYCNLFLKKQINSKVFSLLKTRC